MTPVVICVCAEVQTAKAKMRRRLSEILKKYREGLRIQRGRIIFLQSAWVRIALTFGRFGAAAKREWLGRGLLESPARGSRPVWGRQMLMRRWRNCQRRCAENTVGTTCG